MKLKRCPNLHYYDGDKYDQCPHCAQTETPAPAPKPVFEPAPKPEPEKKQPETPKPETPAPVIEQKTEKAETPAPQPEPTPEKVEIPVVKEIPVQKTKEEEMVFTPADEDAWRCKCGAVNNGKFCFECGAPKPVPEKKSPEPANNTWKCSCGAENKGKFCYQCGSPKPDAAVKPSAPEIKPEPVRPAEQEISITAQLDESKFTGTMEDARKKASGSNDEGVTQVVFDEIDDGFVLAWLTVKNSSSKGKVFNLTSAKNTIGRADPEHPVDVDIHNDRGISRGTQATIVYDPLNKKFFLQSAGGKTFVYVNKEILLTYKELSPYDIIRVGETDLVFVPLCCDKFSW